MRVSFDVHGATEGEIRCRAIDLLATFTRTAADAVVEEWDIDIEVHPEIQNVNAVIMWRGEVTASDGS
jgi:hypothetical protein